MEFPSPAEIQALSTLIQEAAQVGDSATAFSAQRLRVCVEVGDKLRTWKAGIPRGEWLRFVGKHFPDLEERTSQRWMRLAEAHASGRLNVDTARGLRHAYQLAGLLPDADHGHSKPGGKAQTWVAALAKLLSLLQNIQLDRLTTREKNDLRTRLQPVVSFYESCR